MVGRKFQGDRCRQGKKISKKGPVWVQWFWFWFSSFVNPKQQGTTARPHSPMANKNSKNMESKVGIELSDWSKIPNRQLSVALAPVSSVPTDSPSHCHRAIAVQLASGSTRMKY